MLLCITLHVISVRQFNRMQDHTESNTVFDLDKAIQPDYRCFQKHHATNSKRQSWQSSHGQRLIPAPAGRTRSSCTTWTVAVSRDAERMRVMSERCFLAYTSLGIVGRLHSNVEVKGVTRGHRNGQTDELVARSILSRRSIVPSRRLARSQFALPAIVHLYSHCPAGCVHGL